MRWHLLSTSSDIAKRITVLYLLISLLTHTLPTDTQPNCVTMKPSQVLPSTASNVFMCLSLSHSRLLFKRLWLSYSSLEYSTLGRSTKINSWELLWPNLHRPHAACPSCHPTSSNKALKDDSVPDWGLDAATMLSS